MCACCSLWQPCVCLSVYSTVRPVGRSLCLSLRLAAASFGRKSEATKLYFIFLLLSCITDFIWMIIYGNQVPLICQRVPYICQRVPYPLHERDRGFGLHPHAWCTQMWCPVRGRCMGPSSVCEVMSTEINTHARSHTSTQRYTLIDPEHRARALTETCMWINT